VKNQSDCPECRSITPGQPRCRYCLSDLIAELGDKLSQAQARIEELEKGDAFLCEAHNRMARRIQDLEEALKIAMDGLARMNAWRGNEPSPANRLARECEARIARVFEKSAALTRDGKKG